MLTEYRKWTIALAGIVLATTALLLGAITQEIWVWAFSATVVGFMLGNGVEHLADR